MPTGTCPECEADVHVDTDADKGETVDCEECGMKLEVVGLDPVELDMVEEEDLDDDEDQGENGEPEGDANELHCGSPSGAAVNSSSSDRSAEENEWAMMSGCIP